jgi:hypothetical protein
MRRQALRRLTAPKRPMAARCRLGQPASDKRVNPPTYHFLSQIGYNPQVAGLNLNNRIVLSPLSTFPEPCFGMEERKGQYGT